MVFFQVFVVMMVAGQISALVVTMQLQIQVSTPHYGIGARGVDPSISDILLVLQEALNSGTYTQRVDVLKYRTRGGPDSCSLVLSLDIASAFI